MPAIDDPAWKMPNTTATVLSLEDPSSLLGGLQSRYVSMMLSRRLIEKQTVKLISIDIILKIEHICHSQMGQELTIY
jgi:hypothetical protein